MGHAPQRPYWACFLLIQMAALVLVGSHAMPQMTPDNQRDLWLYYSSSAYLLHGRLPYRDFALEYPPLALLPFVLPRIALGCHRLLFSTYLWAFLAESAAFSTLLAALVGKLARRYKLGLAPDLTLGVYAAFVLSISPLLPWRYDLFPALLSALALLAALGKRPLLAGVWLGLGIAAKLYPVVLLPVLAVYYWTEARPRDLARLGAGCLGAVALCALPFVALPPAVSLAFLKYHELRGLEIESLPAGLILLGHALGRTEAGIVYNYGALHLVAPGAAGALRLLPFLFAALYSLLLLRCRAEFAHSRRRTGSVTPALLVRYFVAALLAFIVTNKVFSPQYVVWLLPFAALLRPRDAALLLAVFVLTTADYPVFFPHLMAMETGAILLLNARNFLALFLLGTLLAGPKPDAMPARVESPVPPAWEAAHVPN